MVTRRRFLKAGAAGATGIVLSSAPIPSADASSVRSEETLHNGSSYDIEIPDTLDLGERGASTVNSLTGAADPEHGYDTYHVARLDHRTPYMSHSYGGPCMQKAVHALPMMRLMTGSTQNSDFDPKMMEAITRDIDDDGLWWLKTEGKPWRAEAFKEDFVNVSASGRFMVALADWYRYDRDPRWLSLLDRMANGLRKIALQQGDRTIFRDSFLRSGWPGPRNSPLENGQIYVNGLALRGFTHWAALSEDKKALDMAQELATYLRSPAVGTWHPSEGPTMVAASENAHWEGHFHSHTTGMIGLIEYATLVNDADSKRFVANFYEYTRNFGIAQIGFFPAGTGPLRQIHVQTRGKGMTDEGCAVADMIVLGILLSDSGAGDYWDDVDRYVRNQLAERQFLSRELMEEMAALGPPKKIEAPKETGDRVIERQVGSFSNMADPTISYGWWVMCCLGNCSVALYKAWESIVRCQDGIAQVNLLLNRASPWLDIESYLPYEGKVVLRNKTAKRAYVRIPLWSDKHAVQCRVNQTLLPARWLNSYLVLEALGPGDIATIEFPVTEKLEKHMEPSYGQEYLCQFKGGTLIDISPRPARPAWTSDFDDDGSERPVNSGYPFYQREFYKAQKAPLKRVRRYVSPVII